MENESEIIPRSYTPVEIDRLQQLDHVCQTFNSLNRRYRDRGTFWVTKVNLDGNNYSVIVTPKTLHALYIGRKSLLNDLEEMGLEEESQDIYQKYLRQNGRGSQASGQQEGRM